MTTILNKFKKDIPKVTDDAQAFFDLINEQGDSSKWSKDGFIKFAEMVGDVDESLLSFLKNTDYSEKSLDNYQKYLQSTTFGVALKIVATNMAIMAATTLAIKV